MAKNFASVPATGITPIICGDAHLGSFGFYASPERDLVFDLNDFDEAHPGSWEWDLRRLVTSVGVAGRQNGAAESDCGAAVASCVAAYRRQVRHLAEQPLLSRSFERLDLDRMRATASDDGLLREIERASRRARTKTSDRALPRFTEEHAGQRRIVEEPPLITRVDEGERQLLAESLDEYLITVPSQWRRVLAGYSVLDIGHKVEYQQALQTVSDPLLGWTTVDGRQYYVRQFRDMKGAIAIEGIDASALTDYAGICGHLLAKGHAHTSGASMIVGYTVATGPPLTATN